MKKIFQRMLKRAAAKSPRPVRYGSNKKHWGSPIEPAPSYWALIPVKVETAMNRKGKQFELAKILWLFFK